MPHSVGALSSQTLRTHEWTAWVCYEELGVWHYFDIRSFDSSLCPCFGGDGKIPKIVQKKMERCLHLVSCRDQTAQHRETRK